MRSGFFFSLTLSAKHVKKSALPELWQAARSSSFLDIYYCDCLLWQFQTTKKWVSPVRINKSYSFSRYTLKCTTFKVISHTCWSQKTQTLVAFWMFSVPRAGTCELRYHLQSNKAGRTVEDLAERFHREANPRGVYLTQRRWRDASAWKGSTLVRIMTKSAFLPLKSNCIRLNGEPI